MIRSRVKDLQIFIKFEICLSVDNPKLDLVRDCRLSIFLRFNFGDFDCSTWTDMRYQHVLKWTKLLQYLKQWKFLGGLMFLWGRVLLTISLTRYRKRTRRTRASSWDSATSSFIPSSLERWAKNIYFKGAVDCYFLIWEFQLSQRLTQILRQSWMKKKKQVSNGIFNICAYGT